MYLLTHRKCTTAGFLRQSTYKERVNLRLFSLQIFTTCLLRHRCLYRNKKTVAALRNHLQHSTLGALSSGMPSLAPRSGWEAPPQSPLTLAPLRPDLRLLSVSWQLTWAGCPCYSSRGTGSNRMHLTALLDKNCNNDDDDNEEVADDTATTTKKKVIPFPRRIACLCPSAPNLRLWLLSAYRGSAHVSEVAKMTAWSQFLARFFSPWFVPSYLIDFSCTEMKND